MNVSTPFTQDVACMSAICERILPDLQRILNVDLVRCEGVLCIQVMPCKSSLNMVTIVIACMICLDFS